MSRYSVRKKGFSLLELIGAVAILSIGIVSVLQALSFSVRVTGLSCDMVRALHLAQDKMQDLEFKEQNGLLGKEPDVVQDKSGRFNWKYALSAEAELKAYRLNLDITWKRANKTEKITLNTLLRE